MHVMHWVTVLNLIEREVIPRERDWLLFLMLRHEELRFVSYIDDQRKSFNTYTMVR
jgi:hypothetical protein